MYHFQATIVWSVLALLLWIPYLRVSAKLRFSEAIVPSNEISSDAIQDDYHGDESTIPGSLVGMDRAPMTDIPGRPLDPHDFNQASDTQILNSPPIGGVDPTTIADKFEGDIVIPNTEMLNMLLTSKASGRNAVVNVNLIWPGGIVPYVISSSYDSAERSIIASAMNTFHTKTCIRFVPRAHEDDYIFIRKGNGCSSAVGRVKGEQTVSLGNGCVYYGIVCHELMHAVGFWHEQSRADRDNHVTIIESNVKPGMLFNFQKYSWSLIQHLGQPYDTGSVMHYGEFTFSRDRSKPTIIPHNGQPIGQRSHLSEIDLKKLNMLYKCDSTTGGNVVIPPSPKPGTCIDSNEYCKYWSGIGECENNAEWMKVNCRKSCKTCDPTSSCKNDDKYCKEWAEMGECKINPSYMLVSCQLSCNVC